jgi:hypothetical protein
MATNTMTDISYGISRPQDLLEKLKHDGDKVGANPHKYDLFNSLLVQSCRLNLYVSAFMGNIVTLPVLK